MRFIPESDNRADWPRLVAQIVNSLLRRFAQETDWASFPDFADDAAAAAGGVEIGGKYRTGSIIKVRVS